MRENNEDRYLVREGRNATLLAVADGVGGEAGGEMASAAAINALAAGFFGASPGQTPADALAAAMRGARDSSATPVACSRMCSWRRSARATDFSSAPTD